MQQPFSNTWAAWLCELGISRNASHTDALKQNSWSAYMISCRASALISCRWCDPVVGIPSCEEAAYRSQRRSSCIVYSFTLSVNVTEPLVCWEHCPNRLFLLYWSHDNEASAKKTFYSALLPVFDYHAAKHGLWSQLFQGGSQIQLFISHHIYELFCIALNV